MLVSATIKFEKQNFDILKEIFIEFFLDDCKKDMNKIILPLIMKSTKIKIHFKLNVFTLDYFIDLNFQ